MLDACGLFGFYCINAVGWLAGWLAGWLVGWLVSWLVACFFVFHVVENYGLRK